MLNLRLYSPLMMMNLIEDVNNLWPMVENFLNLNYKHYHRKELCLLGQMGYNSSFRQRLQQLQLTMKMLKKKTKVMDYQETKNLVDVEWMLMLPITSYHRLKWNFQMKVTVMTNSMEITY